MPLGEAIDRIYTSDVFLHRWDLARATGYSRFPVVDEDIDDINDFGGEASLGYGLWVALVGGILILVGALLAKRTKAEPAAQPVGAQGPAATFGDPRAVGAVG